MVPDMRLPVFHLGLRKIAAPVDAKGRFQAKARHALLGLCGGKGVGRARA
jgi:hypothetical protein